MRQDVWYIMKFQGNLCLIIGEIMTYYDEIAQGYNELHKDEQLAKLSLIKEQNLIYSQDTLLDVGCGTGFSLDYFDVKEAVGIDPSQKLLDQYDGKHHVLAGSAESLPFADDSFDVVVSVTAVQNFTNIELGLQEIKRVGKDRFLLSILKSSPKISFISELVHDVFSMYKISRVEGDVDYLYVIQRNE
jgi:ubiquinone/menaquinone biosynthesis C-methylase UbiE